MSKRNGNNGKCSAPAESTDDAEKLRREMMELRSEAEHLAERLAAIQAFGDAEIPDNFVELSGDDAWSLLGMITGSARRAANLSKRANVVLGRYERSVPGMQVFAAADPELVEAAS